MANSSELHHEYYLQFATLATFQFVRSSIGLEKLKASKDKYFNDVIRMPGTADARWIWDSSPMNLTLARELGEVDQKSLPSKSTHTCVGKAAARKLLNDLTAEANRDEPAV
jgi:hypothetical protein